MEDLFNKVIQADCLEFLKALPNGSVDLVLIDPPYNIGKDKAWDKWKLQEHYIKWLGSVFLECQRTLKQNGSFYFWHNDFKQIAELQCWIQENTKFVFKSMISWVKPNFRKISWANKTENSNLRVWFNIQEYCLHYTFEDSGTGWQDIHSRVDCFKSIKEYMRVERDKLKEAEGFKTTAQFNDFVNKLTNTSSVVSKHYFNDSQWLFPTQHIYKKLQTTGFFQKPYEELRAEYEELRAEYEELRAEYEELRPKFNISSGSDVNNVWYSNDKINNGKMHSCQKPQDLLQKIISTSSNENDIVLDCFSGSGSTAIASILLNRRFIGCELNKEYVDISNRRISNIWQEKGESKAHDTREVKGKQYMLL